MLWPWNGTSNLTAFERELNAEGGPAVLPVPAAVASAVAAAAAPAPAAKVA